MSSLGIEYNSPLLYAREHQCSVTARSIKLPQACIRQVAQSRVEGELVPRMENGEWSGKTGAQGLAIACTEYGLDKNKD